MYVTSQSGSSIRLFVFSDSAVFNKVSTAIRNYGGHAQQANIVSLSQCLEQLYSRIFLSNLCNAKGKMHVKVFFVYFLSVCVFMPTYFICNYVLCVSTP